MDARAFLLKLYFNIESAYYEFLDALDNHVPIYKTLVNPIENAGYPSFPVYLSLFVLIILGLFLFSGTYVEQTSVVELLVKDSQGRLVSGVEVTLLQPGNGGALLVVASGFTEFNGKVQLIAPVGKLRVQAEKQGYETSTQLLEEFPRETVQLSLTPTTSALQEMEQENEARQRFLQTIERLSNEGFPQFKEAFDKLNNLRELEP